MSGRYHLVERGDNILDDENVWGIYYRKGRVIIVLPTGWFVNLIYGWILCNVILAIWTTFFPQFTMIYTSWWVICPVLAWFTLKILLYLNRKYNEKFNPFAITKLPFILFVILIAYGGGIMYNRYTINGILGTLTDHEMWLRNLQYGVDNLYDTVDTMDKKFTKWSNNLNAKYTKLLQQKESVQKVEALASKMWEGFGLISVTRKHFGLGCFVNGTLIQIDYEGNVKRIEDLNEFDMIYNPELNVTMKMKVITIGPEEDGFIYEFITNDGFQVSVTKTHPMKICNYDTDDRIRCENVAAQDVYSGNITQTINGYQKIIAIHKIPANNVTVYNLMLDMDKDEDILHRTIVANKMNE